MKRSREREELKDRLLVIPALKAGAGPDDAFILTRKFVDGVREYAARWPGPVAVAVERAEAVDDNLDHLGIRPNDVPFALQWIDPINCRGELANQIATSRLVLASLVDRHVGLAGLCAAANVPLVYVAEYSVLTRQQIVRAETANLMLRWKRQAWTRRLEDQYRRAVMAADGVQCNGTPTYEAYSPINNNPLLFFDNRVRHDQLAPRETIEQRTRHMLHGLPLRLAFSGRLIAMKGADHLLRVAAELKRLGVPFTFDICGDGALRDDLQVCIKTLGLRDQVRLRGVLDFHAELLPFIAASVDLFVCCHRQGDPSCTYLETMACGTPIIGYDNEAFRGLSKAAGVGWVTPLDQPEQMARRIAALHESRRSLAQAAQQSREFAARHTFENTMQKRIDHMHACAAGHERAKAGLKEAIPA